MLFFALRGVVGCPVGAFHHPLSIRRRLRITTCIWLIYAEFYYEDWSCWRFLAQRALAALRADSDLSLGVMFLARAFPPLAPPSLPKSRAASLFSSSVTQRF